MSRRAELIRAEDERCAELSSLLAKLTQEQIDEPGYNGEWSVKDMVAHIASWQATAVTELERIRMGTYTARPTEAPDEHERRLERQNREFFQAWHELPLSDVRAEWWSSRNRLLEEWGALPEITLEAERLFSRRGVEHYDDHLPRLREWIDELSS